MEKYMNILAIGNSFSEDATRYLHNIARADGERINVVNLYIGGCTLDRHYRNMLSGDRAYELQYNGFKTGFTVSLSEALLNRSWDVVTLQQASLSSFKPDSYRPYIEELAAYVRKCAPKAKLYMHETWAYEDGSDRLEKLAGYSSAAAMAKDVVAAYTAAASLIGASGVIPSGELFMKLLTEDNGISVIHRDTFHASFGIGRYALGLLWYRALTKKDVIGNAFRDFDEPIPEDTVAVIQRAVQSMKI